MTTGNPGRYWLLIADGSEARLVLCKTTATRQWEAEQVDRIGNDATAAYRRPPTVLPVPAGAGADASDASPPRTRSFHRILVDWVTEQARRRQIDRLEVFAPANFLAELREMWSGEMVNRLHEHGRDLRHFQTWQIAELPAVRRVLEPSN
jgi:hypothetical protein